MQSDDCLPHVSPQPIPLINPIRGFVAFTNCKCASTTLRKWFVYSLERSDYFVEPNLSRYFGKTFAAIVERDKTGLYRAPTAVLLRDNRLLRLFVDCYGRDFGLRTHHRIGEPGWYRFVVVRNPFDRLVSAFVDKFCGSDAASVWMRNITAEVCRIAGGRTSPSFADFVHYVERSDDASCNRHWRAQSYFASTYPLNRVVKVESLEDDMMETSREVGVAVPHEILRIREQACDYLESGEEYDQEVSQMSAVDLIRLRSERGGFPDRGSFYTQDLWRRVALRYASDLMLFGYRNSATPRGRRRRRRLA